MAKKKKGRKRQGLFSKVANIGIIALGFSRVIELALGGKFQTIINEATFDLAAGGKFNLNSGLRLYAPAGAAIGLGMLKKFLMKKFPVR